MTILTEPEAKTAKHTIRAVAFVSHPDKGSTAADIVVANNGHPVGQRIRNLVASTLGDDWTVFDWHTAEGEF